MPKKKPTSVMNEGDYNAMCTRMIVYAQRGPKEQEIVKSIAKAGGVAPVIEYIDKFKKMFVKFQQKQSQAARKGSGE